MENLYNTAENNTLKLEGANFDKETMFDSIIFEEIINAFVDDLEEAGFEKEGIDQFLQEIYKYDNESIKGVFAMPKELREKNFPKYKEMIDSGKKSIKEIVEKIKTDAENNGYTLGYHTSKIDIEPKNGAWEVKGTELDDRDDMTMAYYSLDYKNIYRIDRGDKLYIVRAKIGENSEHRRDTSNNWGRATSLSIVHKIDLKKIDEEIDEKIGELKKAERDAA